MRRVLLALGATTLAATGGVYANARITAKRVAARRIEIAGCAESRLVPNDPQFAKPSQWMLQHGCYERDVDSVVSAAELAVQRETTRVEESTRKADSISNARADSLLRALNRREAREQAALDRQNDSMDKELDWKTDSITKVLQAEGQKR